ncbi:MAG: hypothetical protein ABW110_22105 [Steroidobacteraceae bacterium]
MLDDAELAEKVRALRASHSYPQTTTLVETIETHFAWIFLTDTHAFKLKKPVVFPGMDLRLLGARRLSCDEELRLNRHLAADIYLGTVALVRRADGSLHVGGEGMVVDWLVMMRRLPATAMLDRAMADHTVCASALTTLGVQLARFYGAQPWVAFTPEQYRARIAEQIRGDGCALLAPELHLDPDCVQSALDAVWRAISRLERDLDQRATEKRIVEAHGDLRPEHICLIQPPCVIDALEFSKDLRTLDPAEELAFLWVECEYAGDVQPASQVLEAYRQESGDPVHDELLEFYRSRRALVRAKIVAWHLRDPAVMNLAPWRTRAEAYVAQAERHARRAAVPADAYRQS